MGYSQDLFLSEVDENLVCAICHDVFENPHTLTGCGHAFCKACLDEGRLSSSSTSAAFNCPTCRQEGDATTPAYCVQGIIDNLQMRCRHHHHYHQQPNRSCSPSNTPEEDEEPGSSSPCVTSVCEWVGKVSEWPYHARHDCVVRTLSCEVEGCGFMGTTAAMEAHNVSCVNHHVNLLVGHEMKRAQYALQQQLEERIDHQLSAFEKELGNQRAYFEDLIAQERTTVVHLYLSTFCRRWMQGKPKSLVDFEVYHETKCVRMKRLLCLVPGPKGSRWRECKFPFMLEWASVHQPPVCRLPHELRHYYTAQTLPMYHITKSDRWEPDVGIPELLLSLQQFMGRADVLAQSEALHRHHSSSVAAAAASSTTTSTGASTPPRDLSPSPSWSLLDRYKHSHFFQNAEAAFEIHARDWQMVAGAGGGAAGSDGDAGSGLRRRLGSASTDGNHYYSNAPTMMM